MLEDGEVNVLVKGNVVAQLGKGAHFGEQALLTAQPRNADVIATTQCTVLEMTQVCDGDGVVGGGDLGLLFTQWGPCPGCDADLNGDGFVRGDDLGLFFILWGPCP